MYLFTRTLRLATGSIADAMAWAVGMTERVNTSTGLDVSLFNRVFSPELGTLAFAAFVPQLSALVEANDTLMADSGYLAEVDRGAQFTTGGADDGLLQLVHGEPDPTRDVQFVATVQAIVTNGHFTRGAEVGVALAQHGEKVTGIPTLFGVAATGPFGAVGWVTGYESIDQYETFEQQLYADADWLKMLDTAASEVFSDVPGASEQLLWRRVV